MPIDYIKDLSDKHNIPVDKLETQWNNAKETIADKYSDNEKAKYGAIVKVFKNMINKEFDLHESEILTVDDSIFVARKVLNENITYKTPEQLSKMSEIEISKYSNDLRMKRNRLSANNKYRDEIQKEIEKADRYRKNYK